MCAGGVRVRVVVMMWAHVGHADPSTTKLYDRRGYNPEKSLSFYVNYWGPLFPLPGTRVYGLIIWPVGAFGSVRRRYGNKSPDRVPYPFLRMVDSTEKGHEWHSISIRIKRNNSVTIPTARLTARSVRTLFGPIVASIIKYIVMPASIFGSLPKELSFTI